MSDMNDQSRPEHTTRTDRREQATHRRRRRWFLVGAVVVVVALVAGGVVLLTGGSDDSTATPPTSPTTKPGSATVPTTSPVNDAKPVNGGVCSAEQVIGAQAGSGLSGTNQIAVFTITNNSTNPCTLSGSPTLALVDADGNALPTTVTEGGGAVPADLTLQAVNLDPGAQASFVVTWAPVGNGCENASSVKVTLPNSKGTVKIDASNTVCAAGAVNVSPIQPGVVSA